MNKYMKIYVTCIAVAVPPWGLVLAPLGLVIQVGGLAMQFVGLAGLLWLLVANKPIWSDV